MRNVSNFLSLFVEHLIPFMLSRGKAAAAANIFTIQNITNTHTLVHTIAVCVCLQTKLSAVNQLKARNLNWSKRCPRVRQLPRLPPPLSPLPNVQKTIATKPVSPAQSAKEGKEAAASRCVPICVNVGVH